MRAEGGILAAEAGAKGEESSVLSLARGLNILRAFRSSHAPLSNKEIAERTGLPKPTVARLCYTLVRTGHLRQIEPNGSYRLHAGVSTLGDAFLQSLPVRRVARPLMQQFADAHDVSVALGMREGSSMAYVEYCSGPDTVTMRLRAGSLIPLPLTVMGRAYLWALPHGEREQAAAEMLVEFGAGSGAVEDGMRESFAELDQNGFCVSLGTWRSQVFGAAAPVWLDRGRNILALNAGATRQAVSETQLRQAIGPDLVRLSTEITNAMDASRQSFWGE